MKLLLELVKPRITAAATTTTAVGYILARGQVDWPLVPLLVGIFLQACGSAALNHVQEAPIDARMERTSQRPIPSGRISRLNVGLIALTLLITGSVLLWWVTPLATALGLAAAVVYNGIYTPLKRVTPFAAIPGSLIGAIPPVAGWLAAGGYLSDPKIHQIAFFFFLWQIPHFWLLLLFYQRSYQASGLPSLFDRFTRQQIARLTFTWISAVAVAGCLMPLFGTFRHGAPGLVLAAAAALLVLRAIHLLRSSRALDTDSTPKDPGEGSLLATYLRSCRVRFMEINAFALLVMVVLVTDRLV